MVLEGRFEFTLAGETRVVEAGTAAVVPGNVAHSGKALTACRVMDVFYPCRDDYR
jgi:quercetin dioxygenase-like cupin family protein